MARKSSHTGQDEAEQATEEATSAGFTGAAGLMDVQVQLFEQFDHVASQWLDHRREDLDATRQSIDELRNCERMDEVLRVQQEWMNGSMRRLWEDWTACAKVAFSVPRVTASRFGQAATTMSRTLGRGQEERQQMKEAAE
jgi:hypothetical protein